MTDATPATVDYDPFAAGELSRVVPTTQPQREVWLADQLGRDASLAYNESILLHLDGVLDVAALAGSLQDLVDRHDALRATIAPDGMVLCIRAALPLRLERHDLSQGDASTRAAALAARRQLAVETPFALADGPLLRAELLRSGDDAHVLMLTAHHAVCDGWSWWLMVRELAALYGAHRRGDSLHGLQPAPSFADHALAQADHAGNARFDQDLAYWLGRFADGTPVLELPVDRPRPARRSFASLRVDHVLDAALLAQVRQLGARRGASLFATLIGTFATLLSRIAGQSTVVVGIPAAGQSVDGNDGLVGHCVNLLPLRFDIDPARPVSALVDDAQRTLLDAIDHQRLTFGTLLQHLQVPRDASRLPLASVMFNIDQAIGQDSHRFDALQARFATNPRAFETFELFVNAVQLDGGLQLECQYNSDLFDAATIATWMQAYEALLRSAVQHGDAALSTLSLVDASALRGLAALQPAATPFDARCAMHQHFERQCDATPLRIALVSSDASLTYAQLDARANRIAAALRARGVHAGMLVGLALDRGPDMLAGLLGILKTGAGYVPLDPAFPAQRLAFMVGDAGLAALLTEQAHAARFDLRGRPVLLVDALDGLGSLGDSAAGPDAGSHSRVPTTIDAESIAYVIYTSGSTGTPKGVQVPHRAVANFITAMQARPGIEPDDVLVAVTTLSFDIAVLELLLPLSVGARVVLADRDTAMDGPRLRALLDAVQATVMQATPATWRLLVEARWQPRDGFSALCGGEPLPPELASELLARGASLWNLYGPTETTVWSTCAQVESARDGISIGTPIANTSVWVVDAHGQPCPRNVPGELCIGGAGVTRGYLGREALTQEKFIVDGFVLHDAARHDAAPHDAARQAPRLYRTGDRGRWRHDGTLEHLGRLDNQVKVRGYRIELGEIEAALAACSGVAQAQVLVREDRPGDVRIVGYVVPGSGTTADIAAIQARLAGTLPDYMLPQHIVVLSALPLLPNGKLDRNALPKPVAAMAAEAAVAPRNDLERGIATAMAQVLGVPSLGAHDNFFALGGHSLLAAQLTSRINRELGAGLTLRALFDAPTVAQLADITATTLGTAPDAGIPLLADRTVAPLSLMQERLWMLDQLVPGQLTYNTPSAHRLRGPLDVDAFSRALDALLQRQAVLRTALVERDGVAVQVVHDQVDAGLLPVIDLTTFAAGEREARGNAIIAGLIHTPFALDRAPLFRARLIRLADDHHLFFFMAHHAIWDGWSFDVLYADLSELYAAQLEHRASTLAELPVGYADFSAWHRDFIDGPRYAAQLAFWREQLGRDRGIGAAAMRPLPTDMPRKPGMSGEGKPVQIEVARAATDRLHALALAHDTTLFVSLLTVYVALIARVTGQHDIVIATPVRGRNSEQTEGLMGYFTNLLPLRVRIDPAQPFAALQAHVKSVLLDSFANPDIRLEDVMGALGMRGDDGGTVLYHALFSFQDIRQRIVRWGNVDHERVKISKPGATEDLGLWFVENEHGLTGALTFNVDILLQATATLLWQRYHAMLDALLADPGLSVAALSAFDDGQPVRIGREHPALPVPPLPSPTIAAAAAQQAVDRSTAVASAAAVGSDDVLLEDIVAVWREVLARPAIGPDDDFFASGGHSLHAVQMFHRLARMTQVNLPLATLLAAPTARGLAQAYRVARPSSKVVPAHDDPWSPLVPMRAGSSRHALFFIHAVGGNVLNYRPLATQMPAGLPVYGLQALGLDGRTPPLARITDMATRYVREIRRVQPSGPYHLVGGSMGGIIAYEMAQQLHDAGETVALLGLIDTSARYGQVVRREASSRFGRWLRLRRQLQGMTPLQAWRALRAMAQVRRDARAARRAVDALQRAGHAVPHDLRYGAVETAHYAAYRDYVVQPYAGTLTLFRAEQQRGGHAAGATLGWSDMASDVVVHTIPGDHEVVVEAPELSRALCSVLPGGPASA